MLLHCQFATYNTLRVSALVCHIGKVNDDNW